MMREDNGLVAGEGASGCGQVLPGWTFMNTNNRADLTSPPDSR